MTTETYLDKIEGSPAIERATFAACKCDNCGRSFDVYPSDYPGGDISGVPLDCPYCESTDTYINRWSHD